MWTQETKSGKVQYFERYTDPMTGKKRTVSVTLPNASASNRKVAETLLFDRIRRLELLDDNVTDITLKELKEAYIEWKKANLKEQTAIGSEHKLNTLLKKLGSDVMVSKLSVRYINEKLKNDSAVTYNERIKQLKAMLRWAVQNDYLSSCPLVDKLKNRKVPTARTRNAQKYLEHNEIDLLLDHFIPKWRKLTEFLLLSGLRIGEALDLKLKDVNLAEREIYVKSTFSLLINKSSSVKTEASERTVYIQDELLECIKGIDSKGPHLFEYGAIKATYGAYNKYFRENTETLLGRKLGPHCLRHTHTALLAEAGLPLQDISARLGHANSDITREIYLHFTDKMIEARNERIKPLTLLKK